MIQKYSFCVLFFILIIGENTFSSDNLGQSGDDLIKQVSSVIPQGWSVELSGDGAACFVRISTNEMETKSSMFGSGNSRIERSKAIVTIQILPRYSPAMVERIREHNKPLRDKLKPVKSSKENQEIKSKMIDEPMFYDKNYGFDIQYPQRVPNDPNDSRKLMEVMSKICREWKSYDPEKKDVMAEVHRIWEYEKISQ